MNIKKMLFVTRFDELRFDALQTLLDLRKSGLEHVVLLNVIEREKVAFRRGKGYDKEEEIKLREMANIRFIDWAENLFEKGMEVGVYIVVGPAAQQVISAAEKEAVDLIVMGRLKTGKLEQFYIGSEIPEIGRRASAPVLIYKYLEEEGKILNKPFERPLLATDWSPSCKRAVELLKPLKDVVREVDVIHVASMKDLDGSSAMGIQKTRKKNRKKLEEICDTLEAEGIQARAHVYIGEAVDEIEKAARECRSSMIIMGTSGVENYKRKKIGNIPRQIAEHSIFPTLLVPADTD